MSRPASLDDIPTYARSGETLISVQLGSLAVSGKILTAAAALLAAVEKTPGVSFWQEHNTITVTKDKTPEEVTATLRSYQNDWDANQEKFALWEEFHKVPEETPGWVVGNVLGWARKEFPDADLSWLTQAHKAAKVRDASK
jgi:hypothetical protein